MTTLKDHFHDGYEMIFIEAGSAKFVVGGHVIEFEENSLIFINNLERHEMAPIVTPYIRYAFILGSEFLDTTLVEPPLRSVFKNRPKSFNYGFKLHHEHIDFVKSICKVCYDDYINKDTYWELNISSNIASLFVYLYRNYKNSFPISTTTNTVNNVFEIQNFIDKNFTYDISLNDISSEFHLDLYYLSHIFKEVTGYSIKQYIILKRISFAKNLLYYTKDNITTVATQSGFNNVNNFIRTFKKLEGIPPLKFRNSFQMHPEN